MWKVKKRRDGEPSMLELSGEGISITLTNRHIDCPDEWVFHCHVLNMNTVQLGTSDLDEAKTKALLVIGSRIDRISRFLQRNG